VCVCVSECVCVSVSVCVCVCVLCVCVCVFVSLLSSLFYSLTSFALVPRLLTHSSHLTSPPRSLTRLCVCGCVCVCVEELVNGTRRHPNRRINKGFPLVLPCCLSSDSQRCCHAQHMQLVCTHDMYTYKARPQTSAKVVNYRQKCRQVDERQQPCAPLNRHGMSHDDDDDDDDDRWCCCASCRWCDDCSASLSSRPSPMRRGNLL
jgi:hypothetical protein